MNSLRNCITSIVRPLRRNYSAASGNLVNIDINDKGVAVLELNRPPVNSLNLELLEAMYNAFIRLENEKCKGMILTSTSPTVFSAGLDIREMYKPTVDRARKFWGTLQNVWIKLYSSPYPTVAAMNGHSPAGGCLLALSCEYRIIVPKVKIGLNETQLGIVAPFWFADCMKNAIGVRQTEKALIAGTMFTSEEALNVGLVDEIATNKEDLMNRANKFMDGQIKLPALARNTVKLSLRKETLNKLLTGKEADTKYFIEFMLQPKVQAALGMYLESLKKK